MTKRLLCVTVVAAAIGCGPEPGSDERIASQARFAAQQKKAREESHKLHEHAKLTSLPKDAVIVDKSDPDWWVIETQGSRYLARYSFGKTGPTAWELTYAGPAKGK